MSERGTNEWAVENYGPPCRQRLAEVTWQTRTFHVAQPAARHFRRLVAIFAELAPDYYRALDEGQLDDWSFNCRKIGGSSNWSNHAFALAVDLDALRNAQGVPAERSDIWKRARPAVERAEREGFRWGGRFPTPDPMHFESHLTPDEIVARYRKDGSRRNVPLYRVTATKKVLGRDELRRVMGNLREHGYEVTREELD